MISIALACRAGPPGNVRATCTAAISASCDGRGWLGAPSTCNAAASVAWSRTSLLIDRRPCTADCVLRRCSCRSGRSRPSGTRRQHWANFACGACRYVVVAVAGSGPGRPHLATLQHESIAVVSNIPAHADLRPSTKFLAFDDPDDAASDRDRHRRTTPR